MSGNDYHGLHLTAKDVPESLCDTCDKSKDGCPMNPPGKTKSCIAYEPASCQPIREAQECSGARFKTPEGGATFTYAEAARKREDELLAEIERLQGIIKKLHGHLKSTQEAMLQSTTTNPLYLSPSENCRLHHVQNCSACDNMGCDDNTSPAKREIERLKSLIVHCDECGSDWVDNGVNSGCYCKKLKEQAALIDKLKNMLLLSPYELCMTHNIQNCHFCERYTCCDNSSPAKLKIKKLREVRIALRKQIERLKEEINDLLDQKPIAELEAKQ